MTDRSLAGVTEEEGNASFSPQDQEQPQQRSLANGMECLQLPLLHHRSPPHQESSARCLQQQRQDEEDALPVPLPLDEGDDQDVVVVAAEDRNALDRLDSLLSFPRPPEGAGVNYNHSSGRRRARTLDVEWGGTFSYDDDDDDDDNSSLSSGSEDPFLLLEEEDASVDQQQQLAVEPTFAPPPEQQQHHYHNYGDSANPPTTSNDLSYHHYHYHLERYHRCRHALHKSRVLRGLLLFCMYGSMEIWPNLWAEPVLIVDDAFPAAVTDDDRWTTTATSHGLSASADRVQQQQPRRQWHGNQNNNNTVAASAAVRRAKVAAAASGAEGSSPSLDTQFKTTVPLYQLPHFSNPRGPALRKTPPTLLRTNQHYPNSEARARNGTHAPGHYPMTAFAYYALEGDETDAHNSNSTNNNKKKRPRYHSTMPPGADPRHWKKIPPPLPSKNSKNNNDGSSSGPYRKKKPRPILSYAHSYRLRQEALVFGHESNINFLSDSGDAPQTYPPNYYYYSANDDSLYHVLIWMTLILLVVDTLYREYQHVQWRRRSQSTLHGGSVGSTTRPIGSPRLFLQGMRRYYQYAAHRVVALVMGRTSNNNSTSA